MTGKFFEQTGDSETRTSEGGGRWRRTRRLGLRIRLSDGLNMASLASHLLKKKNKEHIFGNSWTGTGGLGDGQASPS